MEQAAIGAAAACSREKGGRYNGFQGSVFVQYDPASAAVTKAFQDSILLPFCLSTTARRDKGSVWGRPGMCLGFVCASAKQFAVSLWALLRRCKSRYPRLPGRIRCCHLAALWCLRQMSCRGWE